MLDIIDDGTLKDPNKQQMSEHLAHSRAPNGDKDPDLPSGDGNYRCGGEWHTDPASDRKIEPCNLSTTTPLVINRDTDPVDLTKKANPCLRNEEHKQKHERKATKL